MAPDKVASGANFTVTLTPDPLPIPTSASGYDILNLRDVQIRVPVPAGAAFVSASLSGGSNLGAGTPTVGQAGGIVTLSIPGTLSPGTTAVLPTITVTMQATGAPGTVLDAILAGTSYDNPGISFTAKVQVLFFQIDAPTNCFVYPSPVFATTTVQ